MYLGRRILGMTGEKHRIYNHGGASYVLNQASVELLANHLDDDACQPHTKRCWEDMLVRYSRRIYIASIAEMCEMWQGRTGCAGHGGGRRKDCGV